ncbi:MAG: hypothetical protein ACP5IC_00785 [Minisyncoccia bacterium]
MDDLITKIKKLEKITPDTTFKANVRALLLVTPHHKKSFIFSSGWAFAFGFAIILLAISIFFVVHPLNQPVVVSFDSLTLTKELNDLAINQQMQNIVAFKNANNVINKALQEVKDKNVNHLNNYVLNQEQQSLNINVDSNNAQIDQLLKKAIY